MRCIEWLIQLYYLNLPYRRNVVKPNLLLINIKCNSTLLLFTFCRQSTRFYLLLIEENNIIRYISIGLRSTFSTNFRTTISLYEKLIKNIHTLLHINGLILSALNITWICLLLIIAELY